jgi:prepilin-type N-terminal cleavage/methylation domain-containing protein
MHRRGMTLVEMLVATTMSLIIMGIVAQLFGVLGNNVNSSRSTMDVSSRLRSVANKLRQDLAGVTVSTLPPVAADADAGYLEIIEGAATDASLGTNQIIGDGDDVLMFTTRAPQQPFVGVYGGSSSIESPLAEVAWFCLPSSVTTNGLTLYNLYRRQLLVMSYVGVAPFLGTNSITATLPAEHANYDLSLRQDGTLVRPNSLGDLTKRENRYMHFLSGVVSTANFPYNTTVANLTANGRLTGVRLGEDIVLSNVLAFDVRVFDPAAVIRSTSTVAVTPGDPGYASASTPNPAPTGAYVDLGSGIAATSLMGTADARSKLGRIYDTWSTHYESNGIDEDGDGIADEGTDGIDNNNDGVIDDLGERETSPPYPVPLRGIEIRIRVYEPSSRQVRQVTVRHTFVPH